MTIFTGLDVGGKATAICVMDGAGKILWQGQRVTDPDAIGQVLRRFDVEGMRVGLESGSYSPWLCRCLRSAGFKVVCMDARRAADAIRSRRVKTDKADAWALAEMLRTGWYSEVYVKSEESHRLKALLGARDQLVRAKRALYSQVRGLLRPFGLRLPSRQGTKRFMQAAYEAVRDDAVLLASVSALLETLAAVESQIAVLDEKVKDLTRRDEVCWRLMSVPGVGPITALAFKATIEDIGRFSSMRDIGVYLGLTVKRYQSSERDVSLGISRQGDKMTRHYLYEAANVLLTTVRKRSALKSWGLRLIKKRGAKRARVAVARKLAVLLGRIWKDGTHFETMAA